MGPRGDMGVDRPPRMTSRAVLLFAFAFAVMADPVSSVAYAIEAALRALRGDLALLLPTMTLVVAIIVVVIVNYHQLVGRYPQGGGAPAAAAEAFGEASAFIPIAALIVDFGLTIAISTAAAASAIIAFFPALAGLRAPIALLLIAGVAARHLVRPSGPHRVCRDDRGVRRPNRGRTRLRTLSHAPFRFAREHRPRPRATRRGRTRVSGSHGACHGHRGPVVGDRAAWGTRRSRPPQIRPDYAVAHRCSWSAPSPWA